MYQNQTYGLMVVLPWFFLDLISSASDLRYGGTPKNRWQWSRSADRSCCFRFLYFSRISIWLFLKQLIFPGLHLLQISDVVILVYDVKLWGGKYVDVGDFGTNFPRNASSFWELESWVILSSDLCHVRCACMAGQSILIKKSFIGFGRDRTGVARGLSLVWCVVFGLLLYVMPFIITYLSLHSVFRLWIRWIRQRICSDSDLIRYYLSIYIRKG